MTAHPVEKHEAVMADHEDRIQALERVSAVREEQVKTLYTTLGEIKQMIADIRVEIGQIKAKPGRKWESLEALVLAAIVSGVIGFVVAKVLGA